MTGDVAEAEVELAALFLDAALTHPPAPVVASPVVVRQGRSFRGAAAAIQSLTASEWIISGPAETGKTIAALTRLDQLVRTYPHSQHVILRKTYNSAVSSVVQSFINKVLPKQTSPGNHGDVHTFGGQRPLWFDYENGSRIWVGGMDNPDKVLSSERDSIYVNQAEEFTLADWAYLTTRATGRAGNMPYGMVFGDCNPGSPHHWIKKREGLILLESRHEDNPMLYDEAGQITPQGERSMAVLDKLPGVIKDRLRYGRWVQAEGAVYEFDEAIHLIGYNSPEFPYPSIPMTWRRIRVIDFGFTNPFACQWWAIDHDGRMYLYREIYMTQRTVKTHSAKIKDLSVSERIETTVADHDAEDRATLEENGIPTEAAVKSISVGIQKVQERLAKAGDGRPRLFVLRDALIEADETLAEVRKPVNTQQEFSVYLWPKGADGKPMKETPIDDNNHGMDAMRYAVMYVDGDRASGEIQTGTNPVASYRG